ERSVTLRRVGDSQDIMVVYHGPAGAHPDAAALDVLCAVLGGVPSGRLYKALVDNKKAVAAGMGFESMRDPGFIIANVRLRTEQNIEEARQILIKTVEGLVAEPPSKEEVERAKARLLKNYELLLTNSESVGLVFSESAAMGDWRLLFVERDDTKKV